ncbi:MAG TPA: hypothetical protein VMD29_15465 [Terracidiphilus sp.]|jgi:hypothetical protein|nr:hypothetical protein [Terracidiphilus sp.]
MSSWLQPTHLLYFLLFGVPAVLVFWVIPLGIICRKAGFSPWLTLLNCIPFGNTILLYLLAIADWKRRPMFVPGTAEETASSEAGIAKSGPQVVTREI